jgi:hypothetical protein
MKTLKTLPAHRIQRRKYIKIKAAEQNGISALVS